MRQRVAMLAASGMLGLAGSLPAQVLDPRAVQPLPPRSAAPLEIARGAELQILDVQRAGSDIEPIRVNDVVPVEVVVRNVGDRTALIQAGAAGDPARGGSLMRYGRKMWVAPGATVRLPLELHATGNRFAGGRFEVEVFLFDGSRPARGPVLPLFRDAIDRDNRYRASFEFAPPVALRANDDCAYGTHGCNRCVPGVAAAFDAASGSGNLRHSFTFEPTDRSINGPVPDVFSLYDHIQGVARVPGLFEENVLALSRNARDVGDAAIYLVRFDGIVSRGDAWKWAVSRRSDDTSSYWYHRLPGANHAGGMQALGTLLFVANDCDEGHRCHAFVEILDVRDPAAIRTVDRLVIDGSRGELRAAGRELASRAAAVGALRLSDGRILLFVRGRWDEESGRFDGWFFRSRESEIGAGGAWELYDAWTSTELTGGDARNPWESVHLVGECGTGRIHLIGMGADGNTSVLYRVVETPTDGGRRGEMRLERVQGRGLNSGIGLTASTRYGGGVHVTPRGGIVSYITDRQPDVGIDEFRHHGEHGN